MFSAFMASEGLNVLGTIDQGFGNFFAGIAAQRAYESQARLALLEDRRSAFLEQDALRSKIGSMGEQYASFLGMQNAAHAFSGFSDYSTGDVRLSTDTVRKWVADVTSANVDATLKRQETEKQAMMNAISLRAQAKGENIAAWAGLANSFLEVGGKYQSFASNKRKQNEILSALGKFSNVAPEINSRKTGVPILSPV